MKAKKKRKISTQLLRDFSKTKRVCVFGLLGALCLVLGGLENMVFPAVPFLPAGAKIGLSNIVTMFAGSVFGFSGAVYITLLKALFALVTRGATAFFMSLCGGILSVFALSLTIKKQGGAISFIGIGVLCAVCFNLGQLFCACVLSGAAMLGYGKYLLSFAVISGTLTGAVLNAVMPRLTEQLSSRGLTEGQKS